MNHGRLPLTRRYVPVTSCKAARWGAQLVTGHCACLPSLGLAKASPPPFRLPLLSSRPYIRTSCPSAAIFTFSLFFLSHTTHKHFSHLFHPKEYPLTAHLLALSTNLPAAKA
ncbi:hypothetical protein M431DRAFT_418945 [Trichoderma harzianum CBS 226.95]|uniref:Uncharacterized protein n=1 Tax=Trichoderma harzianum CBS 226.95 TaxID=983964 RepID=A0A2T4AGV5_TRIHA|nr:hypothetical protein M431DRAFT_418945 [Trichoderma harzianum CBS 226.95]PTB56148.1 hypothetical protein M431DRAFT_418945 [Trichoderma harzianum CBS 226.95]